MAAKAGQILQAELLVVYGADPGAPDINGRTPLDYARYVTADAHYMNNLSCDEKMDNNTLPGQNKVAT